jgi:hypothetical protein
MNRPESANLSIRRLAEQLDDLLVGCGVLLGRAAEPQRLHQLAVGHHQTIGEPELGVDQLTAERHVAQLVRKHRRQAGFVGQHVDEATAEDDRVADGERLERRGQQNPRVQRLLDVQLVGDDEVVEPRTQRRLVEAWAELHLVELQADWERLQAGRPRCQSLRYD